MGIEPLVNVIMSVTNRPQNLINSLDAWAKIEYPYFYFTIVDNGSGNPELENIAMEHKDVLRTVFFREPSKKNINVIWNKYGKMSSGEYVIFSMMDEIISHRDIIQKMIDCSQESRVSIFTYFMTLNETMRIEEFNWRNDPTVIPRPYTDQTTAGLISHITGNFKKNWEWFGWFRDNPQGHLWIDQDLHLRELCLGAKYHCRTPRDVYCLHQYHKNSPPFDTKEPGYQYKTEAQARLLEPAERDRS